MAEAYPWQAPLWQQLASRSRHAHAYLLHGPAGIGKRDLAERLMARLLCQKPDGLDACGQCKACHLLTAGTHPDLFVLEPEEADKAISLTLGTWLACRNATDAGMLGHHDVPISKTEGGGSRARSLTLIEWRVMAMGRLLKRTRGRPQCDRAPDASKLALERSGTRGWAASRVPLALASRKIGKQKLRW